MKCIVEMDLCNYLSRMDEDEELENMICEIVREIREENPDDDCPEFESWAWKKANKILIEETR